MKNGFSCPISQEVTTFNSFLCVLPEFSHAFICSYLYVAIFPFRDLTQEDHVIVCPTPTSFMSISFSLELPH